ncbi:MAG: DMT family transporter [Clostridiales bacterium]|nr:DMT family transporter [Clostridiales bacterium]
MEASKNSLTSLLILPVIWGSYYVASQQWVGYTSVFTSGVGIRLVTLVLLTAIMLKRKEFHLLKQVHGVFPRLLLIGTLGFLLDFTAFIGLSLSSAASGTALLKCDVLMVNVMSVFIYKQRFTLRAWLCTFVMLAGVFVVMGFDFASFRITDPGNIFFLLSAFFVSCNAFVIKSVELDKENPVCDDVVAYYNNFVTLLFFLVTSLVMGTLGQFGVVLTDPYAALALALAGLGQTLIYVVYYYNLRNYPVWLVKTFLLLMPVVATIITFVLFGEVMVLSQYLGMAVVLAGAVGILLENRHEAAPVEE